MFNVLLSFSNSLTKNCVSLNDEPCMIRSTIIDLNPVEFKYYPLEKNKRNQTKILNYLT